MNLPKCLYCQGELKFNHGEVYSCTNCPCDVEYYMGESTRIGFRGTKLINQAMWFASHNGKNYQVTVQPSEMPEHFTHSTIIRRIDNNRRPIILILNCIPKIKPGCSDGEFNVLLKYTNDHPDRGIQFPCYYCQIPMPIMAGNLDLTLYQRGGGVSGTCYHCHQKNEIHHSFKEQEDGTYKLTSIWWGLHIGQKYYNVHLDMNKDKFILSHVPYGSDYDEDILKMNKIPHITPQNAENKIQTLLVFS